MLKTINQTSGGCAAVALLAACAFILSCSSEAQTNPCPQGSEPYTEYRLFFGLGNADNPQVVSDAEWNGFLEDIITREFPDGLTVLDAYGQYTDSASGALIKEKTKVLIILVPRDDGSAPGIDRIIEEYKRRFSQQGVLRETKPTCASF